MEHWGTHTLKKWKSSRRKIRRTWDHGNQKWAFQEAASHEIISNEIRTGKCSMD